MSVLALRGQLQRASGCATQQSHLGRSTISIDPAGAVAMTRLFRGGYCAEHLSRTSQLDNPNAHAGP